MEGKYNIKPTGTPYNKHDHVIFHLSNDTDLRYNDTRKFGRMMLVDKDNYRHLPPLSKLGQEPQDAKFEDVYERIHRSSLPIKTLLLDQSILTGIGNIYANEICFRMRMDPRTRGKRLSKKRIQELIDVSRQVLDEAIKQGDMFYLWFRYKENNIEWPWDILLSCLPETEVLSYVTLGCYGTWQHCTSLCF